MKKILILLTLIVAVSINSAMGAVGAVALGCSPVGGAIALNAAGVIAGITGVGVPAGALGAGVFTEVWTGEMNKAFKMADEAIGWYKRIRAYDDKVENDVIHFVNIGGSPKVLINNTTYPIGISALKDTDKPIGLDKYQTERTIVTDDELHAISYDKMSSTIERHKNSIEERKYAKAIHALAPAENKVGAPVIATSGAALDGRKALTKADILRLKKEFDRLKVPSGQRVLVLCADHVNDLLALDQNFERQYHNYEEGKIGRTLGFDVYEYADCPHYIAATGKKKPFGAAVDEAQHTMASVAFADTKCMRADGSLKMYYLKSENNPATQASEVNFRKYSICLPLGEDCIGAIYSAKA